MKLNIFLAMLLAGLFADGRLLPFQGYLADESGRPVNNTQLDFRFSFYDAATNGRRVWTSSAPSQVFNDVKVEDGYYSVALGGAGVSPVGELVGVLRFSIRQRG